MNLNFTQTSGIFASDYCDNNYNITTLWCNIEYKKNTCMVKQGKIYKYQSHIDHLLAEGYCMPDVTEAINISAFRYVFSNSPERNHIPVCIQNPKRQLPDGIKLTGYSLSCFADGTKAEKKYYALQKSFRLISSVIGDSLANGVLTSNDGMVTEVDTHTSHFDLFEYKSCNLNNSFTIKKALI